MLHGRRDTGSVCNPALERDNRNQPAEGNTSHCYGEIEEKHHVVYGADQRIDQFVLRKSVPICRRMAAKVICSVLKMKVRPPAAKKKLATASVGGREGSTDCGGRSQRKK
jgi:hypothetical protein